MPPRMFVFRPALLVVVLVAATAPPVRGQSQGGVDGQCADDDHDCSVNANKEKAFFNTYSSPEVQAKMLLDKPRTSAYREAMMHALNADLFKGKHVIDVGCGTGVLALFAAAAGAKVRLCSGRHPTPTPISEQIVPVPPPPPTHTHTHSHTHTYTLMPDLWVFTRT